MAPALSVVLLTWNEARNAGACLDALAAQTDRAFELIVIDAASTDGTAAILAQRQDGFPVPMRLVVADTRIPIGEARNRGVALAQSEWVAFLSADAEPGPGWVAEARRSLASADLVFGRQVHAPHRWTVGASVRGLRYRFPDDTPPAGPEADALALALASNVAAAYKRQVLRAFPFDAWANAAEDLLLARRAVAAGWRAAYNPRMVVRHHDVADARVEWRKNWREGRGWAVYRRELGTMAEVLAWGAAVGAAAVLAVAAAAWGTWIGVALLAAVLWAPALRRAVRRVRHMPVRALLVGVAASPPFDLAFLVQYVRGLAAAPPPPSATPGDAP